MRMFVANHKDVIEAELQIGLTLLDFARSKLEAQDTGGTSRAVRNAELATEGIRNLLGALDMADADRDLRTEFVALQEQFAELREKIAGVR